jgi:hypothetical protein
MPVVAIAFAPSTDSEAHEERDSQDRADHEADEHQCDEKAKEAE